MLRSALGLSLLVGFVVFSRSPGSPVPKPKDLPTEQRPNQNQVLKKQAGPIQIDTSSTWTGYPAQNLIDGKLETGWYSENGDCKAKEREPAVTLTLSDVSPVQRVTVYGNRDPQFPTGYGVLEGQLLLLDAEGRVVMRITREARGEKKDFDFLLAEPCPKVKVIKFRVLKDESQSNPNGVACVALSEIHVD